MGRKTQGEAAAAGRTRASHSRGARDRRLRVASGGWSMLWRPHRRLKRGASASVQEAGQIIGRLRSYGRECTMIFPA